MTRSTQTIILLRIGWKRQIQRNNIGQILSASQEVPIPSKLADSKINQDGHQKYLVRHDSDGKQQRMFGGQIIPAIGNRRSQIGLDRLHCRLEFEHKQRHQTCVEDEVKRSQHDNRRHIVLIEIGTGILVKSYKVRHRKHVPDGNDRVCDQQREVQIESEIVDLVRCLFECIVWFQESDEVECDCANVVKRIGAGIVCVDLIWVHVFVGLEDEAGDDESAEIHADATHAGGDADDLCVAEGGLD